MSNEGGSGGFHATRSIDCCGKKCPMPIYTATKALASMKAGEILEVKCTDAASVTDFPDFVRQKGHELLATEKQGDKVHVFYVRKGEG